MQAETWRKGELSKEEDEKISSMGNYNINKSLESKRISCLWENTNKFYGSSKAFERGTIGARETNQGKFMKGFISHIKDMLAKSPFTEVYQSSPW